MKKDITNHQDLLVLLDAFYEKAMTDAVIGQYFTKIVPIELNKHIPLMASFWESILFEEVAYDKDIVAIHQHIHHQSPFSQSHFNQWVQLFKATIDELFYGVIAEKAKQRAESIATVIAIHTIDKIA